MSDCFNKNQKVVIVDSGIGNLLSIQRAFEFCGASILLSSNPDDVLKANKIVLPGVGAFPSAMIRMREKKINDAIIVAANKGVYLMGICLGMQMLFSKSYEMELTQGLNLIKGEVIPITGFKKKAKQVKIPNIGWRKIQIKEGINNPLLKGIMEGNSVYFLHSYKVTPRDSNVISADIQYEDINIPAVVWRENIFGCQFHPEKSGQIGLKIIKNFIEL